MRKEIAEGSRTGFRLVQSPARRKLGIAEPVLQIGRAIVIDGSDFPFVDQLARERNRGRAAVVVTDHVNAAVVLCGFEHLLGFGKGVSEWLFAKEDFSCVG